MYSCLLSTETDDMIFVFEMNLINAVVTPVFMWPSWEEGGGGGGGGGGGDLPDSELVFKVQLHFYT